MEKRDLYNKYKENTQFSILKEQEIPENYYTLVVLALIQNSKNEILVQKRSIQKGGEYGLTSGHPKSGENSLKGIITEIKEELGLTVNPNELKLFKTLKTIDDFIDIYYLKSEIDINKLTLQKEEVEEIKWATPKEIKNLIENNLFLPPHIKFYKLCLEYLKTKKE